MSELRADTITASDGTSPVTLTKQEAAKAWINYDGTSAGAVSTWARYSLNMSVITDSGNGNHTVGFTSNMSNANYAPQMAATDNTAVGAEQASDITTSSIKIRTHNLSGSGTDRDYTGAAVFGDLA